MARIPEIVFDCVNSPALARFWAHVLEGYAVRPYDEAEIAPLARLGLTPENDPTAERLRFSRRQSAGRA